MELPNIFKKTNEEKPEAFWSLIIDKSWVEAGIWKVENSEVVILAKGTSSSWQEGDTESLVSASDSSMSSAAAEIPDELEEPEKVVFGLHQAWIEEGDIKGEKLDVLKKVSQELELKPSGFVVINEALAHYLKSQEGAPANVLLTGLAEDTVDLTLVQNGKIIGSAEVGKSMDLGQDLSESLAKISALPQYPARILLYNHRVADLEEARQGLLDVNWEKTGITFLHTPRIDILPDTGTLAAVSLAGGAEIAEATSVRFDKSEETPLVVPTAEPTDDSMQSTAVDNSPNAVSSEPQEQLVEPEVLEETIEQAPIVPEKELEEISPEELGFTSANIEEAPAPAPTPDQKNPKPLSGFLTSFASFFKKLRLPRFMLSFPGGGKGGIFGITGALLLLAFLGLGLAYWFLPRSEVTIFVAPKRIEKTLEFSVSPDVSVADIEKKLIPGKVQEAKVTGEKTAQTSGTKVVGDKATGTVTIYRSGPSITLPAGTLLAGPGGLKFALNDQVKVASGSAVKRGEQDAKVTASVVGAEYNLAAGTTFSVANYSDTDLGAENKSAFSGGSSREVAAVDPKDITNLESGLETELLQKGIEELKEKLASSDTLVESSVLLQKDVKTFSAKAGEEASNLKLKIEGKVTALIAPVEGVNQLVRAALEQEVPDGYSLKDDQITISYKTAETPKPTPKKTKPKEDIKSSEKKYVAEVSANLLPRLNPDEISKSIAGKYPLTAKEFLATLPGFTRVEISFNIKFPGRLGTLPRVPKNITIDVRAEE